LTYSKCASALRAHGDGARLRLYLRVGGVDGSLATAATTHGDREGVSYLRVGGMVRKLPGDAGSYSVRKRRGEGLGNIGERGWGWRTGPVLSDGHDVSCPRHEQHVPCRAAKSQDKRSNGGDRKMREVEENVSLYQTLHES
jgi:hypothetical protein